MHLRFDIAASSLPEPIKKRLSAQSDQRITTDGVIIIKAQRYRSQEQNREDALARLQALVDAASSAPPRRRPTRPTKGSQRRRVDSKVRHGQVKAGGAGSSSSRPPAIRCSRDGRRDGSTYSRRSGDKYCWR